MKKASVKYFNPKNQSSKVIEMDPSEILLIIIKFTKKDECIPRKEEAQRIPRKE